MLFPWSRVIQASILLFVLALAGFLAHAGYRYVSELQERSEGAKVESAVALVSLRACRARLAEQSAEVEAAGKARAAAQEALEEALRRPPRVVVRPASPAGVATAVTAEDCCGMIDEAWAYVRTVEGGVGP